MCGSVPRLTGETMVRLMRPELQQVTWRRDRPTVVRERAVTQVEGQTDSQTL